MTFVIDGGEKTAYRHSDAYPGAFGLDVLRWLREASRDAGTLAVRARALRVASPDSAPAPADVERLRRFADGGSRAYSDWYWLLRRTQDNPGLMLDAGVIEDAGGFPCEPLARWGYVADIDARRFEVYQGGQREPHRRGRFAGRRIAPEPGRTAFWPAALAASWPFGALPSDDEFTAACRETESAG